jgi:hypothetical protein
VFAVLLACWGFPAHKTIMLALPRDQIKQPLLDHAYGDALHVSFASLGVV